MTPKTIKRTRQRVAVALSGGMDSAYAAWLLRRAGHDLVGLTLLLYQEPCGDEGDHFSRCCAPGDLARARALARQLDFPHYILDIRKEFGRKVVDYFCDEYARLRTPNPCAVCNPEVKFGLLLRRARELGCATLATGHYARVAKRGKRYLLQAGKDPKKDQSYFLFGLSQDQLRSVRWPLGTRTKAEVKRRVEELGLPSAGRESQEVCFLGPNESNAEFIVRRGVSNPPGPIVDLSGKQVGTHRGLRGFTIGQRQGLGVAGTEPLYVLGFRARENALVIGPDRCLWVARMTVTGLNLIARGQWPARFRAMVKVRYQTAAAAATVWSESENPGRLIVVFDQPQRALTPGQAAVLYERSTVIGGGWIESVG